MKATHRVINSTGTTVGFIVGEVFLTVYAVVNNINLISNLSLNEYNEIVSNKQLPVSKYKDVQRKIHKNSSNYGEIIRDIQKDLGEWKVGVSHKVLQLEGARHVGKTTELLKFAYNNYEYVIHVDMSNFVKRDIFEETVATVIDGDNSISGMDRYCNRFNLHNYVDDKNTLLIIDEIQSSPKTYRAIARLQDNLKCDIVISGCYLRNTMKGEYLNSGRWVEQLQLFTLSFKEFCTALKTESLLGCYSRKDYKKLYRQIGGYPGVVSKYIKTKNIKECTSVIESLMDSFEWDLRLQLNTFDDSLFNTICKEVIKELGSEKIGVDNKWIGQIIEEVNITAAQSAVIEDKKVLDAIEILRYSGIMGTSRLYMEDNKRIHYMDCGIVNYMARMAHLTDSETERVLTDTFEYSELYKMCKKWVN